MNIQTRMDNGFKKAWNWKKFTTVVAAFVLTAGTVSLPAYAVVKNVVEARMESLPKADLPV